MNEYSPVEILVVEDNPDDSEIMVRVLKKNNLANQVHIVEDGQEAIDFIFCKGKYEKRNKQNKLKVIFLDLKLPKLNGLEVLKIIKSDPVAKKTPVVIITSSRENPDITRAYELGANSYMVKPITFNDFFDAMKITGLFWLLVNETSD